MMAAGKDNVEARVIRVAQAALADHKYVSAIDVFTGLGWLQPSQLDLWRQGRVPCLEQVAQASLGKLTRAMHAFGQWAEEQGLKPSETGYVARTRDRRTLRFSVSGDARIEKACRTHWVSPELSEDKRQRLTERQSRAPDLVVVEALRDWTCSLCGGTGGMLIMEESGPVCLACADLDHLAFLPSGNTALTRRAKKASQLSAVVVRFSRARKRYERQGILVEEAALDQAEQECLADDDRRERARQRAETARQEQDAAFQARLAGEIHRLLPACPPERATAIARRAATRGSRRVGRSAAGRALDPEAVTLAVLASVRHQDTNYDALLMAGVPREAARAQVADRMGQVLAAWREADSGTISARS